MSVDEAIGFVERHGVVLESARHATIPSLAEAIAGEPIRGSWWSNANGDAIFRLTRALRDADDVLVCRLVDDKVTFAHRRVWPALVRLADRLKPSRLARISEVHGANGAHRVEELAFPRWVPADATAAAARMDDEEARAMLAPLLDEDTER
ncbi:MAG: hypothetical protein ABW186_13475 [Rhodanobacteraceae bacterium]